MGGLTDARAAAILGRVADGQWARFSDLLLVVPNPRTLSSRLRALEGEGLLTKTGGMYSATERGRRASRLLREIEELAVPTGVFEGLELIPHPLYAQVLRDYCDILKGRYGERLVGVVLYGSVARGDWKKESDIDVLVVVEGWESKDDVARLRELAPLGSKLASGQSFARAAAGGFVPATHELPLAPAELRRFRTIYLDIALDGIVLLDAGGRIREFIESVRKGAERLGSRRVVRPDGTFYWVLADARPGEVFELGV